MLRRLLPVKVGATVRQEQVRLLYQQASTVLLLGILTAFVSVAMFWKVAEHALLALWLGVHVAVSLIRMAAVRRFNHASIDNLSVEKWGRGYAIGALVSGLIWGSLSLFFDSSWPAPYQLMLFVIYTGITAGAFNTHSAYFPAYPAFYLPPVLCLTYVVLSRAGEGFLELAALLVIYMVLMYVSALRYHNNLAQSLKIRFDNERLAGQLAESNSQLMHLADTDELTGLYNRRSMDKHLSAEWSRAYREQKPLSLLLMDVDFFKQYNDSYGHHAGDECLMRVANVILEHAQRASDMCARFGGEEFAVILPGADSDNAMRIAEDIRSELEALQIPHASSNIGNCVTISIGVASLVPPQPEYSDHLNLAADKALYLAKNQGRNRVVMAGA